MIAVEIFWNHKGNANSQFLDLPAIPPHGDIVVTSTGYESTVASVRWLLDGETKVQIILN